jgi:hypothetical protein
MLGDKSTSEIGRHLKTSDLSDNALNVS